MTVHDHDDMPELDADALAVRCDLLTRVWRDFRASGDGCEVSEIPACGVCQRHADLVAGARWIVFSEGIPLFGLDPWCDALERIEDAEIDVPSGDDLVDLLRDVAEDLHAFSHQDPDPDPEGRPNMALDKASDLVWAIAGTIDADSRGGQHESVPSAN